jgi:radical SAM protein with 4Fe4S-binding SPASM domain
LSRFRDAIGHDRIGALMTTTERSLEHPEQIVDEYVNLGFTDIFVRPISPYGFAIRTQAAYRYHVERFLEFFRRCLSRVFYWNTRGVRLVECYSQLIARKLLSPFPTSYVDLQHPAGTGISAIVYNYDGDVYASDEGRMLAEMNDQTFRLGNVHSDSYAKVLGGDYLKSLVASSCLQTVPQCSECAFMPFCGFDSAYNIATQNDLIGRRPTSGFCTKQMGLFRHVIGILDGPDSVERDTLIDWAVN